MPNLTERQVTLIQMALALYAIEIPRLAVEIAEIQEAIRAAADSGLEPALLLLEESP